MNLTAVIADVLGNIPWQQCELGSRNRQHLFVWIDAVDQEPGDSLRVSRSLYNGIVGDTSGASDTSDTSDTSDNWQALRARVTAGPYVDINRVLITQPG